MGIVKILTFFKLVRGTVSSSGPGAIGANKLDKALLKEAVICDVASILAKSTGETNPNSETPPKDVDDA